MSLLPDKTDFTPGATLEDLKKQGLDVGSKFLPRIQLSTSSTKLFKAGKIQKLNSYTIVWTDDKFTELESEVNIALFDSRLKALDMRTDNVIQYFDAESEGFKEVTEIAKKPGLNGCMSGIEFLAYEESKKQFCFYFLASFSQMLIAEELLTHMGNWVTLTTIKKHSKQVKQDYFAPDVKECVDADNIEAPDPEEVKKQIEEFRAPPAPVEEQGEADSEEEKER